MDMLPTSHSARARRASWIRAAGWLILLMAAGAALLPWLERAGGARLLAAMMLGAGAVEVFAGALRHETPRIAMTAGAVSILAGLLFLNDLSRQFTPFVTIVMGWLIVRAILLSIASRLEHGGGLRFWTGVAAATDMVLALLLAVGLSIAGVILALFGEAEPVVASFAWVLAGSFVASGLLLLEVASCASDGDI
jgi:hypothetical protein